MKSASSSVSIMSVISTLLMVMGGESALAGGDGVASAPALPAEFSSTAGPNVPTGANTITFDPLRLMPDSTTFYLQVNMDAAQRCRESLRGTRLGQRFDRLWALTLKTGPGAEPMVAAYRVFASLAEGLGGNLSVGISFPPEAKTAGTKTASSSSPMPKTVVVQPVVVPHPGAKPAVKPAVRPAIKLAAIKPVKVVQPDVLLAFTVKDMAPVRSVVDVFSRVAAAAQDYSWKEEREGDNVIRIAYNPRKPQGGEIVYSLIPGALVVGSSSTLMHRALRGLDDPKGSLAEQATLQGLLKNVDRSQLAWAFENKFDWKDPVSMLKGEKLRIGGVEIGETKPVKPDAATTAAITQVKEVMAAQQGAVHLLSLFSDHLELRSVVAYDPNTAYGKKVLAWQNDTFETPALSYAHSAAFIGINDLPNAAPLFDSLIKPLLVAGLSLADDWDYDTKAIRPQLDSNLKAASNVVNGSGGEMAIAIGPVKNAASTPHVAFFIERSDNPRLKQGMDSILKTLGTGVKGGWYTKWLLGTPIQTLGTRHSPTRPSHAVIGNYEVLSPDLGDVYTPLYLSKDSSSTQSLADDPAFQKFWSLMGPEAAGVFYLDLQSLAKLNSPSDPDDAITTKTVTTSEAFPPGYPAPAPPSPGYPGYPVPARYPSTHGRRPHSTDPYPSPYPAPSGYPHPSGYPVPTRYPSPPQNPAARKRAAQFRDYMEKLEALQRGWAGLAAEFTGDLRQAGGAIYTVPTGFETRAVITFDPNGGPPVIPGAPDPPAKGSSKVKSVTPATKPLTPIKSAAKG